MICRGVRDPIESTKDSSGLQNIIQMQGNITKASLHEPGPYSIQIADSTLCGKFSRFNLSLAVWMNLLRTRLTLEPYPNTPCKKDKNIEL